MSRHQDREVFGYCRETCPDVDGAFYETLDSLKDIVSEDDHIHLAWLMDSLLAKVKVVGTEKLRDALRACVSDKNDAEGERDELRAQVKELEAQVSSLEADVKSLERELEESQA